MLTKRFKEWIKEAKSKIIDPDVLEVLDGVAEDPDLDFMISADPSFWSVIRGNILTRELCMDRGIV